MTVIGIDPGYQITGFGIVKVEDNSYIYLASGCILLKKYEKHNKLIALYAAISNILAQYKPTHGAIEQVFFAKNHATTIKLGQILGVAICAMRQYVEVVEYPTKIIKLAVTGSGNASKECVQDYVRKKLNICNVIEADASDALAVSLCHIKSFLS